jgi:CheY-like chemotaxis protein
MPIIDKNLGLYSLGKRIEALNGEYGVKSRNDNTSGSVFWFTIPYKPLSLSPSAGSQSNLNLNSSVLNRTRTSTYASTTTTTLMDTPANIDSNFTFFSNSIPSTPMKSLNSFSNNKKHFEALLVDDSMSILKMMKQMMVRQGMVVEEAENGLDAIKKIDEKLLKNSGNNHDDVNNADESNKNSCYDVVMMDLQMPIMDGFEAIQYIRNNEKKEKKCKCFNNAISNTDSFNNYIECLNDKNNDSNDNNNHNSKNKWSCGHQFIIAMSANSDSETVKKAYQCGVDAFIAKPFTFQKFHDTFFTKYITKKHLNF